MFPFLSLEKKINLKIKIKKDLEINKNGRRERPHAEVSAHTLRFQYRDRAPFPLSLPSWFAYTPLHRVFFLSSLSLPDLVRFPRFVSI